MSVVIETTIGDVTVDLFIKERPRACQNFLKLCKLKYYNFCLFHTVQREFIAQTGDPEGTGKGGTSLYGILYGEQAKYFEAEKTPKLKHQNTGTLSFASHGDHMLGSQFFVTLAEQLEYLDGDHCVFGQVVEGLDVLVKLNAAICDENHQPYQDIRITHTVVLDDPLEDPAGLEIPDRSPPLTDAILNSGRIAADEDLEDSAGRTAGELEEMIEEREARARATILEMVGDLPDADSAPPENVLFVCKLNPVTTDDDLQIIFSRFGKVVSCEIIRDQKTGNSLQYGFIEFDNPKSCENAYFKMDNVLIDDRRIHVDFSQSVSKVKWRGKGRLTFESGTAAGDLANFGGADRGGGGGGGRGRGSRSDGGRGRGRYDGRHGPDRNQRDRGRGRDQDRADHPRASSRDDGRSGRREAAGGEDQLGGLNVGRLKALLGDSHKQRRDSDDSDDGTKPAKKSRKHNKNSRRDSPHRDKTSDTNATAVQEKSGDRRRRSPDSEKKESRDKRRLPSPDVRSSRKEDSRDKRRWSSSPDARPSRKNYSGNKKRRSPSPDKEYSRKDHSRSQKRRSRSPMRSAREEVSRENRRRSRSPDVGPPRRGDSRDDRNRRRSLSPDARSSGREARDRRRRSPIPDTSRSKKEEAREMRRSGRSPSPDDDGPAHGRQKRKDVREQSDEATHKQKKRKVKKGDSDKRRRKKERKRRRSTSSESNSSFDSSSDEDRQKKSKRR